jgi:hypothetical protein
MDRSDIPGRKIGRRNYSQDHKGEAGFIENDAYLNPDIFTQQFYPPAMKILASAFGLRLGWPNLRENDQATRKPNTGSEKRTGRDTKGSSCPSPPTLSGRFRNWGEGREIR